MTASEPGKTVKAKDHRALLAQATRPDLVIDLPDARTPAEVFETVAGRMAELGLVDDAARLAAALSRREESGSTGVGNEVAVPHALIPAGPARPVVALVRVKDGVEWHAVDGRPVKLIAVIAADEGQRADYMLVLADVARVFLGEYQRNLLLKERSPERVVRILRLPPAQSRLARYRPLLVLAGAIVLAYFGGSLLMRSVQLPAGGIYEQLGFLKYNLSPWLGRQALVVAIFLGMVVGTLLFWKYRLAIVATGLAALLLAGVMDLEHMVEYMSLPTIIFVMAMMVLIKWVEDKGVFRYIVLKVVERVGGVPWVLLLVLMAFSVVLSGFVGEVSGILVTFGLAVEIARRTKTPVLPYLLALVFATNIGSALTLVGNPIGVYLAFVGQLNFEMFLRWATPISFFSSIAVGALIILMFRGRLRTDERVNLTDLEQTVEGIKPADLRLGLLMFLAVVLLIVMHARAEALLRVPEGTMLVVAPLAAVAFIIFVEQEKGKLLIARSIDWWTLLFFMFLFASAACLEHTGVTTKLGYLVMQAAEHSPLARSMGATGVTGSALVLMLWGSGLTSGFVDNMPIVAALVPVVKGLLAVGLPHASILWWALLFGGCFGGNLTMVGSSANLVAVGMYERVTGQSVGFGEWFKTGLVVTIASLLVATLALMLQVAMAR
ncbi:PTS sugar transporter subunit IIA [candidate division WOR-3 bacterium]|nr:PTS sugar transporter subunit IIA [candidate division WOR-3 bacterium]